MDCELRFITPAESKYAEALILKGQTNVPIGVLNHIEIIFLHYKSEKEAKEKWERRVGRINWDNLIFKFSNQNLCDDECLKAFDELPFKKKNHFCKRTPP